MEKEFIVLSNKEFENKKDEIKKDIERSYENIHHFLKEQQSLLEDTQKVINRMKSEEEYNEKNNSLEKLYHDSKLITTFLAGFFLSSIINFFFL